MASFGNSTRPHVVCVPFPAQGHISPMLKLAKLVHHNGFYVTFVNTEFNHKRLLRSNGPHSLDGLPDFRFENIPDGLPPSDQDATQHVPSLCASTAKNCLAPFRNLINKINEKEDVPQVTCIVSDGIMSFTLRVAEELGIPDVLFWTASSCGFMCYLHYHQLVQRGYTPLKDESDITNGYLETKVDWVPGMKDIRLKDFPSFIRTTDPNDIMLNFFLNETERISKASAIILNTFDAFEHSVLNALFTIHPNIYTIGPLQLLLNNTLDDKKVKSIGSNLWKEDLSYIEWLDTREPNSVVYVNFGSITVMNYDEFTEMAWGLANSKKQFLWIIRPDLITGDSVNLPEEFLSEIKDRGMIASWCPQEKVLKHSAIGGFLTHSGWNSMLESVCAGVPVICWPFFAEQQTNCRYSCIEWEMGMEIIDLKRNEVEILVKELMDGEKGKKMKLKAMKWKEEAEKAASPGGSSCINLNRLFNEVLFAPSSQVANDRVGSNLGILNGSCS